MRIAHFPLNIAGYASRLAAAQRELGHEAVVYSRSTAPYNFPADVTLPPHTDPVRFNLNMLRRLPELDDFDVLHVHGGIKRLELGYYALRGPKVFVNYHGTETRHGFGLYHQRLADALFYTPADLKPYLPYKAVWIPQPIDFKAIQRTGTYTNERPVFLHLRSSDKGEADIVRMFDAAFGPLEMATYEGQKYYTGKDAELRVFGGLSHTRAIFEMSFADVVFDQFTPHGIYGYVAVEAMALGKPVLATVDYRLYPDDCPVLYPNPAKLAELADDENLRREYGERGRRYVERVHEATKVAQTTIQAYQQTFK